MKDTPVSKWTELHSQIQIMRTILVTFNTRYQENVEKCTFLEGGSESLEKLRQNIEETSIREK